jgi:hypothetical protein
MSTTVSIDTLYVNRYRRPMPRYGQVDRDYGLRLATWDEATDGPVHMCNLMKYRAEADYGDEGERGVSGRDADDRYAPVDVLRAIGAQVCFTADVLEASEDWDRIGVVRYPTRRSFIEMQSRDDFKAKHVHKDAGMDHTIVLGTHPVGALPEVGAARLLLEVWRGDAPPGGDGGAAFTVEGTILGDGRTWDGVRYRALADDEVVDVSTGSAEHQLLVVRPTIERWT